MARSAHMQVVRTAMVRGVAAALLAAAPALAQTTQGPGLIPHGDVAQGNVGAAEGELTVRALASTVAALKAELAAKKALEIAERNAGSERDASLTVSPLAKARAEA